MFTFELSLKWEHSLMSFSRRVRKLSPRILFRLEWNELFIDGVQRLRWVALKQPVNLCHVTSVLDGFVSGRVVDWK